MVLFFFTKKRWRKGTLLFLLGLLVIVTLSTLPIYADDNGDNENDDLDHVIVILELSSSYVNINESNVPSQITIQARLYNESSSSFIQLDEVEIEFRTNFSAFVESNGDSYNTETVNGTAETHLKIPFEPGIAKIRAEITKTGVKAESLITFYVGSLSADNNSTSSKPQPITAPNFIQSVNFNFSLALLNQPPILLALIGGLLLSSLAGLVIFLKKQTKFNISDKIALSFGTRLKKKIIAFIVPLATRQIWRRVDETQLLDNPYRQKILTILAEKRIMHLRELKRELKCGMSVLLWHLELLEEFGYVASIKHGKYLAYYLTRYPPDQNFVKLYFSLLHPTSRRIILLLNRFPGLTVSEVKIYLRDVHSKTLKYHIKKLHEQGILETTKDLVTGKMRYTLSTTFKNLLPSLNFSPHITR